MTSNETTMIQVEEQGQPAVSAEARRDALVERMLNAVTTTFEAFSMYMGHKLGYYKALTKYGPQTSAGLAARTGTHERYTREWLEQQATIGILEVINPQAGPYERMFRLPAGHGEVLTMEDSPNYMSPMMQIMAGVTRPMESVLRAYRTGGGVELSEYGEDFIHGQGGVNRVTFLQELGQVWLPSMPDVHVRLSSSEPARVADLGVGVGWSSIGMALQYPNIQVDGYDMDEASIQVARENARRSGVADRVHFHVKDASSADLDGHYDLVASFEALHDMTDPVGALATMRRMANETGAVLVVDERVGEAFMTNTTDIEPLMYGFSILHCLPVGMTEAGSAGTGTVMRPDTLLRYAVKAGFTGIEVLPVDNYFFRFYRMMK